ncbi:MAG: DUF3108 domain-containing protein [Sulfuricella sp.]
MKRLIAALTGLWVCAAQAAAPQQAYDSARDGIMARSGSESFRVAATYSLTKQGQQIGTVTETFKQDDGRYQLESVTAATGIYALFIKGKRRFVSTGEVVAHGLRPRHFEDRRDAEPSKTVRADFDWEKMRLSSSFDGKTETAPLEPGAQDRLSMLYQFMFAPPEQGNIRLFMTTGKKLNPYLYKLAGEEKITTPAGQFQALHLVKQRAPDEDGTEIWLAKKRHYFPVRIVVEEHNGGKLEQNLTSLTFEGDL